jgi:hypothetical protein
MEGSLFLPADRSHRVAEVSCADCGQVFRPRRVGDGAEELCDPCYEARFRPLPLRNGRKLGQEIPLVRTR